MTSMPPVWPCCSPTAASPLCPCVAPPPAVSPSQPPPAARRLHLKAKNPARRKGVARDHAPFPAPRPLSSPAHAPLSPRPLRAYHAPSLLALTSRGTKLRPRGRGPERSGTGSVRGGAVRCSHGAARGCAGWGPGCDGGGSGGGEVGYLGGGGCRDGWGTECGGVRCGAVRCRGFNSVRCPLTAALSPQCDFSEEQTAGE